jgi:hypothetical protein
MRLISERVLGKSAFFQGPSHAKEALQFNQIKWMRNLVPNFIPSINKPCANLIVRSSSSQLELVFKRT